MQILYSRVQNDREIVQRQNTCCDKTHYLILTLFTVSSCFQPDRFRWPYLELLTRTTDRVHLSKARGHHPDSFEIRLSIFAHNRLNLLNFQRTFQQFRLAEPRRSFSNVVNRDSNILTNVWLSLTNIWLYNNIAKNVFRRCYGYVRGRVEWIARALSRAGRARSFPTII